MARPREFEPDEALAAVMDTFWEKGYEGTSLQDIEAATGLNKQSLYRAFGDKRAMYLAALRLYDETEIEKGAGLLAASGTAKEKVRRLFNAMIAAAANGDRRGCFLCNAGADQAQLDGETRKSVTKSVDRMEKAIRDALAVSAPYDRNARMRKLEAGKILAAYFGLRVMVKTGAPIATLKMIAGQVISEI